MKYFIGLIMLMLSCVTFAATEVFTFDNEQQEQQFRHLTEELRCPKCQNNSIADSNSMIALDLRQKVYELMKEGKSRDEIIDYMVARYGYFVTYNPPLTPLTIMLWVVPLMAIIIGGWVIYVRSKKRIHVKRSLQEQDGESISLSSSRSSRWIFLPGIIVALAIAAITYYQVGSYHKVVDWKIAYQHSAELLDRALSPNEVPLTNEEMEQLALGLRTRLQEDPQNAEAWSMLARIGIILNNTTMAKDAFAKSYRLKPNNTNMALSYAEILTRSSDPEDNRLGGEILRKLIKDNPTNVDILNVLAVNDFEQERYAEAISSWDMMLKLLADNDPRRKIIGTAIEQASMKIFENKSTPKIQ